MICLQSCHTNDIKVNKKPFEPFKLGKPNQLEWFSSFYTKKYDLILNQTKSQLFDLIRFNLCQRIQHEFLFDMY